MGTTTELGVTPCASAHPDFDWARVAGGAGMTRFATAAPAGSRARHPKLRMVAAGAIDMRPSSLWGLSSG